MGMLNNKVKNKHDLTGQTRQPIIAELPRMNKKERKNTSLFIKEEQSVMAECFHILCNNVDSLLPRPDEGGHVIMLTSTTPGEGKTFTSANLAAAFAKAGVDSPPFCSTKWTILPISFVRSEKTTAYSTSWVRALRRPIPSPCSVSLSWHRYWNVSEKNTMPSSLTPPLTAYWQIQPSLRL